MNTEAVDPSTGQDNISKLVYFYDLKQTNQQTNKQTKKPLSTQYFTIPVQQLIIQLILSELNSSQAVCVPDYSFNNVLGTAQAS